jgi:3-dehydroquinate synthase
MALEIVLENHRYDISVSAGLFDSIIEKIDQLTDATSYMVVTDTSVRNLYLSRITDQLDALQRRYSVATIADGEASKSIQTAVSIWDQLASTTADRKAVVIALGGGVVGDLAGFVAATYARGLRFVQVPTSLLAQVDSSVGGKVGINLPAGKNLVGAFWQPTWVAIDPECLTTLDDRNYRAGLAEVIKYGVIKDPQLFEYLETNSEQIIARDPDTLRHIIIACCRCKARIVEQDETETSGVRATLNYGHTIGHAIENVFGYGTYLHGEAIAIGMHCEAMIATKLQLLDPSVLRRQCTLIQRFGLPIVCPSNQTDEIIKATRLDKKASQGNARYILPTKIGETCVVDDVKDSLVKQVLTEMETFDS